MHPAAHSAPASRRRACRVALGLAACVAALSLLGCGEERLTIDLRPVPLPEGGSIYSVVALDEPEQLDLFAPSHAGLFIHPDDAGPWKKLAPPLDPGEASQLEHSARSLQPGTGALNSRPNELFSAHQGKLWVAPGALNLPTGRLLVSEDRGESWTWVSLPKLDAPELEDELEEDDEPAPSARETSESAAQQLPGGDEAERDKYAPDEPTNLRLLNDGERGFYLLGSSSLWRLQPPQNKTALAEAGAEIWAPVSLAGTELERAPSSTQLPEVLRHYLPASADRPFEVLTLLRERIHIYRRGADEEEFEQVSSLDGADYQLAGVPGTSTLLLLSSEGLFKSDDGAETWRRINWYALNQDDASGVTFELLGATAEEPAALLVALETGAIYRSEDLGESFVEVRPPDADQRGVVVFAQSARRGRVWAATNGSGVLRSKDRGQTWQPINEELRANRALDIGADPNGAFLLGSDAGLFRLNGPPEEGRWQMLHSRASTAIEVDPSSGVLLNGTTTGAIVRLEPDGKSTASQPSAPGGDEAIAYQSFRFRGVSLDAPAIVDISSTEESSKAYAWSARRGPMISVDAGVSWTPMQLNPAFQNALEGSYISNFRTESNDRIYLITHGLDGAAPSQLWRSYNNGETWHAVSSFPSIEDPAAVFLGRSAALGPETIFIAHHQRFARSVDGGNSWVDLEGPWQDGHILLYDLQDAHHRLIVETRQTISLVELDEAELERPSARVFEFRWPEDMRTNRPEPLKLVVQRGYVFLSTDRGLLAGQLPDSRQRFPDGLAIIITLLSTFLLTLIAYGFVRLALGRRLF